MSKAIAYNWPATLSFKNADAGNAAPDKESAGPNYWTGIPLAVSFAIDETRCD